MDEVSHVWHGLCLPSTWHVRSAAAPVSEKLIPSLEISVFLKASKVSTAVPVASFQRHKNRYKIQNNNNKTSIGKSNSA